MRFDQFIKLIDLDASVLSGSEFVGRKYSSGYAPPELLYEMADGSIGIKSPDIISPLYEPVLASPSHDAWSFGVLLFNMCSEFPLFKMDDKDNVRANDLRILFEFTADFKDSILKLVADKFARNLISQLLVKNPL